MRALFEWFDQAQGWKTDISNRVTVALAPNGLVRASLELRPDGTTHLIDHGMRRTVFWRSEEQPCLGDLRHKLTEWFHNDSLTLNPALVPQDLSDALDILVDDAGVPEWFELFDPERRWNEAAIVRHLNQHLREVGMEVQSLRWETVNGAWVTVRWSGAEC
jgi:hypothetical protein